MAVYLYDENGLQYSLSDVQVRECSDIIFEFLQSQIQCKHHVCIGLQMDHNIYISSIITSLQKLQFTFIFLGDDNSVAIDTVETLKITWILTFTENMMNFSVLDTLQLPNQFTLQILMTNRNNIAIQNTVNDFCIVLTSGTTGEPKFIQVSKHCIMSNVECLKDKWSITNEDRIFFGTPLTFDPCLIELLLHQITGASLIIVPKRIRITPNLLFKTIISPQLRISVLQTVPTVFHRWNSEQIATLLQSELRILAFGGEAFPATILNCTRNPNLRLFNLYGVTELSCWATMEEVPHNFDDKNVSLGEALNDTEIEIRNSNGIQINEGEGEIILRSNSRLCSIFEVASKCANNVVSTGDIGLIRENKKIYYKSRKDDTIKRFGHRINLRFIEKEITNSTQLISKIVWYSETSKLLCFFLIEDVDIRQKHKVVDKLRVKLLHTLPKEMFPDFFDIIPKFPLTCHGKINTNTLKEIFESNTPNKYNDPIELFKYLWLKYLGVESDSTMEYTFSELGGNSILAIQFMEEFRQNLSIGFTNKLLNNPFELPQSMCLEYIHDVYSTLNQTNDEKKSEEFKEKRLKIDSNTFKIQWSYDLKACVDCGPLCFADNERKSYVAVGSFSQLFVVLCAVTGKEVSKYILPKAIESTPAISLCTNYLFVGCHDGKLYCLDYKTNTISWSFQTGNQIKSTPYITKEFLVFGSYDEHLYALNLDGNLLWKLRLKGGICAKALYENNTFFVSTILGNCYSCDKSGIINWQFQCEKPIFGSGAFLDDMILWADVGGTIYALSQIDGVLIWKFSIMGKIFSSLLVKKQYILCGCDNHLLYIISASPKPKVIYEISLSGSITVSPIFASNSTIIVVTSIGDLYLIKYETGQIINNIKLSNQCFSHPYFYNDKIYIGCRNNMLHCINVD